MNTSALQAWRVKAPTKKQLLRDLLSDRLWHSQQEMAKASGYRYGAALFDLHNEMDFGSGLAPVHYETRTQGKSTRVEYRATDKAHCDICSNPKHMRPSERIAQLEKENAELRAEVARLRGGQ